MPNAFDRPAAKIVLSVRREIRLRDLLRRHAHGSVRWRGAPRIRGGCPRPGTLAGPGHRGRGAPGRAGRGHGRGLRHLHAAFGHLPPWATPSGGERGRSAVAGALVTWGVGRAGGTGDRRCDRSGMRTRRSCSRARTARHRLSARLVDRVEVIGTTLDLLRRGGCAHRPRRRARGARLPPARRACRVVAKHAEQNQPEAIPVWI